MKKRSSLLPTAKTSSSATHGLQQRLLDLFFEIPLSSEKKASNARVASQALARSAALKAASVSGTLALPPGPLGWATIFPDLIEVWKIQSQMVSDIAAVHGRSSHLNKETLLFCLFQHGAAALTRDVVVRAGKQFNVRRMTTLAFRLAVRKVGGRVTRSVIEKTIARSIPLLGALAVGGYAYYDTSRVAASAVELFSGEIVIEEEKAKARNAAKKALGTAAKTATKTAKDLKKKVTAKSKSVASAVQKKAATVKRKASTAGK